MDNKEQETNKETISPKIEVMQKSESGVRKGFLIALAFCLVLLAFFIVWDFFQKQEKDETPKVTVEEKKEASAEDLLPQNAKNPEDFLEQVNTKAKEIQKEYDSNLTFIARKKWIDAFSSINQITPDGDFISKHIQVLNSTVEKGNDQSNLFKIKYKTKFDWAESEEEDFFFLIISPEKAAEIGFPIEKSNVFFSQNEISENLKKPGFGQISRLGNKEKLVFPSFEDSIKALDSFMKGSSSENHIVAGNEKMLNNSGVSEGGLFITGKVNNDKGCSFGFISLFDANIKGITSCQN